MTPYRLLLTATRYAFLIRLLVWILSIKLVVGICITSVCVDAVRVSNWVFVFGGFVLALSLVIVNISVSDLLQGIGKSQHS